MLFLKKYAKKYWKPFCIAVIFLALEVICDLLQPTIMSKIIDVGIAKKDINYVLSMGGIMLVVTAVGAICAITRNIVSSNVSQGFGMNLRSDLFKKIQTLSLKKLGKFETASLITRLTNDVTQLQNFVHGLMRIFVKAPLLCIGSIIMASLLNLHMTIIILAVIPTVGVLIYLSVQIGSPFFMRVQKSIDSVNGVMREYLSGVRVVKAFNRFDYETERFSKTNQELSSASIKAMRIMAIFTPNISLVVNLGIAAVLWFGGINVNTAHMHVGQVVAFINYMTQILFSVMMISMVFTSFVRAKASGERISEVLLMQDDMPESEYAVNLSNIKGSIDFTDVCFSYADSTDDSVLYNINFSCIPGETVGIIGSTGSGKSTIVKLISRLYDVSSGCVKVDGVDVRNMDLKKLREKIAVVPQLSMLFTGSIIDNIRWGKEDATTQQIKLVATVAKADEFINAFPEGYDTLLGQGGVNLSGGQKQRISIARALIRNPEILILDDCTSAVDVVTESKIRTALKEYSSGLTCLIIAQRITSVIDADKIIVLDEGKIVGIGTHKQLMQICSAYCDIFYSQVGKEEI